MSKNGFTLIELMIVVAIMGILVASFPPVFSFYIRNLKLNDVQLEENRIQTIALYCMKQFLNVKSTIAQVKPNTVILSNGSSIHIDKNKNTIIFKNGKKQNIVRLASSLYFSRLKKIDYHTFGCYLTLGQTTIPMYWRVGK